MHVYDQRHSYGNSRKFKAGLKRMMVGRGSRRSRVSIIINRTLHRATCGNAYCLSSKCTNISVGILGKGGEGEREE